MPHVTFTLTDGTARTVECETGSTVMQAATAHAIAGIEAICGGFCNCATCHVYVDEEWIGRLPAVSEGEDEMLDGTAADRLPTSRLACQITLTALLDGLAVTMPDRQA